MLHLAFNMFALYMFGGAIELVFGARRYLAYYFACVVTAALTHFLFAWWALRGVETGTPWGLMSICLAVPFLVGQAFLIWGQGPHVLIWIGAATAVLGLLFIIRTDPAPDMKPEAA